MKKLSYYFSDLPTFTNYVLIFIPLIFLFKHNISNFLLSILPLLFFFPSIRKEIKLNRKLIFIYLFFIYLIFVSVLNLNINGIFYLRFLFFVVLTVFIFKKDEINNFKLILKYFIVFFIFDLIFQALIGYNVFKIKMNPDFISGFFRGEKIAGTYLLNLLLIFSILTLYSNDDKNLKFIIYIAPITFVAMILSSQRMPLINVTIFYFFFIASLVIFRKIRISMFMVIICVLLSYILGNFFFNTNIKILKDKFLNLAQYSLILKESSVGSKKNISLTFINHDKYSEIKFKEDLLKNSPPAIDQYRYIFRYEDVFAEGYKNNKWEEIRIKDFINSTRLKKIRFVFSNEGDQVSELIKKKYKDKDKYYLEDFDQKIESRTRLKDEIILEYLNQKRKYKQNDWVIVFESLDTVETDLRDSGWYSHIKTGYLIWKDNFLFGSGIKKFRELCKLKKYRFYDSFASTFCTTHPHNMFTEMLSEIGLIGILSFYSLIIFLISQIYRTTLHAFSKMNLIIILILLFQPFQITGRFFSSNVGLFNFYFIALNIYFLINKNYEKFFRKT